MPPKPYVLVIDDDWMNREVLEAHLESEGHIVKLASNGTKGIAMADEERPALVILDLLMPEMDGIAVLEALRQLPAMQHIPIVLMTGMENDEKFEQALAAGADDFLSKPFNTALMLRRIKTLLRITTLQDRLDELE